MGITYNLHKMDKIYIGYNLKYGHKANGWLKDYDEYNIVETPVAENLMTGLAIGMAMEGFKPVLYFERHDFMLNALDGLLNHLDKDYYYHVIIRACVGSTKPLDPGKQHTQNYTEAFKKMFKNIKIFEPKDRKGIQDLLDQEWKEPIMIIESREIYNK